MLCLKNKLHSRKKCKEQFTENIVILLLYLFVLPQACDYGDSLLILLFYFVLKKKHRWSENDLENCFSRFHSNKRIEFSFDCNINSNIKYNNDINIMLCAS